MYTVLLDGIYQFHTLVQGNGGTLDREIHVDGSNTGSHDDAWAHDD